MKSILTLLTVIMSYFILAQQGEFGVDYQFGIAGSRFRAENNSKDKFAEGKNGDLTASNWLYDHNMSLSYKHQFIKRWRLFWNFSFELGTFYRYNNITWNGFIYDVIRQKTFRTEYQIGLTKRFVTKAGKISFDLGFDLSYRKYKWDSSTSSASSYPSEYGGNDSLEYSYSTFSKDLGFGYYKKPKVLNLELVFTSHFELMKNLHLNVGARVAFSYLEYQHYYYRIRRYDWDGNFLDSYTLQTAGAPVMRAGSYIYLTAGLTYRFDWKELKLFKEKE